MPDLPDRPAELDRLRVAAVPDHEQVREALRTGDEDAALVALDRLVTRFGSLQDYSVNWVASLLSFIGRELGEDAVDAALRRFGDEYLAERRSTADDATPWPDRPAGERARALIRPMVANGATVQVDGDDDKLTLSFRCGTGGRLVDEGRYDERADGGPGYLVLRGDGPLTLGEPGLPVYCAHCSVNNELQPLARDGAPLTVEFPTRRPGEPCVHHVYRDGRSIPDDVAARLAPTGTDWVEVTRRNARSVQTTIGWIFWDPGALSRFQTLGLPGPLGYIAARCAPLAPAGADAVIAAFGSISPPGIRLALDLVAASTTFDAVWAARDDAVLEGLAQHAPGILHPLAELGPVLWPVVEQLPSAGRVFFAAHRRMPRPEDPVLSGWHAVNHVREWRGDTHWALVAAAGLSGVEASVLHNAWLGYEPDWLPTSRGSAPDEVTAAWTALERKGLASDRTVTPEGIALRQRIEDDTDRLTTLPWELLGPGRSAAFAAAFETPCRLLLARVDDTAGPNYQPASRLRPPR